MGGGEPTNLTKLITPFKSTQAHSLDVVVRNALVSEQRIGICKPRVDLDGSFKVLDSSIMILVEAVTVTRNTPRRRVMIVRSHHLSRGAALC